MNYHGLFMDYHGLHELPRALHGLPWTTMDYDGLP